MSNLLENTGNLYWKIKITNRKIASFCLYATQWKIISNHCINICNWSIRQLSTSQIYRVICALQSCPNNSKVEGFGLKACQALSLRLALHFKVIWTWLTVHIWWKVILLVIFAWFEVVRMVSECINTCYIHTALCIDLTSSIKCRLVITNNRCTRKVSSWYDINICGTWTIRVHFFSYCTCRLPFYL